MDAAVIASLTSVCEEPSLEWETLAASRSAWQQRRRGDRVVHLDFMKKHEVYEEKEAPPGVRPLSVCWVDTDNYEKAESRLTARGHEQGLSGEEHFYSATPNPATLRMLLVVAHSLGISVAVGDWAQAFLQAPLLEAEDVWVTPAEEAAAPAARVRLAAQEDTAWLERRTGRLDSARYLDEAGALQLDA